MVSYSQNNPPHFPRQVGQVTLDFDSWAQQVRQQMTACLQRKRQDDSEAS